MCSLLLSQGECQLVPVVFHLLSGAESGKCLRGETSENRKVELPFLLPLHTHTPLQSSSKCRPWAETTSFATLRPNPTFCSLSKGPETNQMSSRVLSKPGPSQGCGQALSFLTSRFAVIPLMPKKKKTKKTNEEHV